MKIKEYLNKNVITESSLSRIVTHVEKTENFGVMSPYRKEKSNEQNLKDYKDLIVIVREMGYGYIPLKGGYTGDEGFFAEKSLFIPNIKRKEMIELGQMYDVSHNESCVTMETDKKMLVNFLLKSNVQERVETSMYYEKKHGEKWITIIEEI